MARQPYSIARKRGKKRNNEHSSLIFFYKSLATLRYCLGVQDAPEFASLDQLMISIITIIARLYPDSAQLGLIYEH